MKLKVSVRRLLVAIIVFLCTQGNSFGQKNIDARTNLNFNTHWAFYRGDIDGAEAAGYDDKDWNAITIPHTIRLEKKHCGGGEIYRGIGWYRRHFIVPAAYKNKKITIHFDGVQMNCAVFLNGEKLQSHFGGYIGFVVDITGKVKVGSDNILALRVSNMDDPLTPPGKPLTALDFNYYGGIYRDVRFTVTSKLYISDPLQANKIAGGGLFITYPEVNRQKAKVKVQTHIVNETGTQIPVELITVIKDKKGGVVAIASSHDTMVSNTDREWEQTLTVTTPHLWHPYHPYLYQVVSQVYSKGKLVDIKRSNAGIRTIAFRSPEGKADAFYINGEKLYLRGANRHQCYQNVGDAAANSMQYRDVVQLKRGGFNAVRAAHYPASPAFLDACDKIGLLVIECEPGWQFFNKKDTVFAERTYANVREMIRRDRNRPSVFLWETSLNESPSPAWWAKKIVDMAHEEMPNDQLFVSDDFGANGKKYYDVCYKVTNEDGTDPMPQMPFITREWGDTWLADPAKENSLRDSRRYTEKGLLAQCMLRQTALNGDVREEKGGYWDHGRLDENPRICGYFLWSFNDYPRGSDSITAFCGSVDIDRYEKFGYYQLQAMQNARNPVYGPMVYIASYNNRPDLDSNIIVFSNCDKVKLYHNNRFVQEITRQGNAGTASFIAAKDGSPYYLFRLGSYHAGELKAEGIVDGKVACRHIIRTPGKADHLEIEVDALAVKPVANGSDMVPFYVKVCDKNGTVVCNKEPFQSYTLQVRATGDGDLIGADIARVHIATQQTEGGIGYGIVRTTSHAGIITITATGTGLTAAQKIIHTLPYAGRFVADGRHTKWMDEKEMVSPEKNDVAPVFNLIPLSCSMLTVSGERNNTDLAGLIDGDPSTIWKPADKSLPVIITISLGRKVILQGDKIAWGKDSDWYTYTLEVSSDGREWTKVINDKKISGQEYKPVRYNYSNVGFVRISISNVQPENSGLAIRDIGLFGTSSLP